MKNSAAKIISVVLCAAVIFGTVMFTRTELHGAVSNPLLYYNDRSWSRENRYPIEKVLSIYYIPVTLFEQLANVEVYKNTQMKYFWIKNGDLYITFDIVSNFASTQDITRMYIKTNEYYGDHYVPAQEVCKHIGLQYEMLTSPITGETAIRITDGNEKLSFEQLVREKYPGFFDEETTAGTEHTSSPGITSPITTPGTSSDQTTADTKVLTDRTIYITIEDAPGEYTGEILDVLGEFGYKATFFIIGDAAAKNPGLISRIAAEGHAIGLHTMSHDALLLSDTESILADIEAGNELLYRIIKRRVHIWRAPEGSASLPALNSTAEIELNHNGYIVWDYNVDLAVHSSASMASNAAVDGIWNFETSVLRLCEDENTAGVLRDLLYFISENSNACEVRTITPAYYEFNNVIK